MPVASASVRMTTSATTNFRLGLPVESPVQQGQRVEPKV